MKLSHNQLYLREIHNDDGHFDNIIKEQIILNDHSTNVTGGTFVHKFVENLARTLAKVLRTFLVC